MSVFVGRENELGILKKFLSKNTASLIVVRGRRRIGKSRLVEEFARGHTFYSFSGMPPTSETTASAQRDEFANQLGERIGIPGIKADDWSVLFLLLAKNSQQGRVIILFDEVSWMGSKDPNFLGKFKNAWDLHFKKNDQLVFILCGSSSSWIERNILSSTGFVGRISFTLTLDELLIKDCLKFWGKATKNIAAYEKLKVLSIIGGVPKYLEEIDHKTSAEDNIKRLCFTKGGFLVDEFEHIFSTLFLRRSEMYRKIVKVLGNGAKEIKEICVALDVAQTGRMTGYLQELELSGFIKRDYSWNIKTGQDSDLSKYRLSDNYLRFYLKYIEKYKTKIERNNFTFKSLTALPEWFTILGLQFENLVLNNRHIIWQKLGVRSEDIVSENPFFQRSTKTTAGCQIDYMIQTKHSCLYVCEIKFSKNQIGASVINEIQEKINRIKKPKRFSCRPVLIHVSEVSQEIIDSDFFAEIIDFGDFLGS